MSNYEIQILLNVYKHQFSAFNQILKRLIDKSVNNQYNTGHDFVNDPANQSVVKLFGWQDNHCPNLIKIYLAVRILANETKLNYNNFLNRKKDK